MSKLNFEKKKFRFPKGFSDAVSKSENDHLGMSDGIFIFIWNKKSIIVFFGVEFTGDYRNVAIILTLFGITVKIRKNRIFHRFFDFTP